MVADSYPVRAPPEVGRHREHGLRVAGTTDLPLAGTAPRTLVKDASQWPRTRLDLTVPEAQLNPHTLDAPLMPWATTVRLTFGYVDPLTATPYSVLVATVRLMETTAERPGALLDLTCADRSSLTDGAMQAADVTYPGGTTVANAIIAAAALDGLGAPVVVNALTAGQAAVAVPARWKWNASPWQAIEDLADLIGAEVFYDAAERLVLRTPPVPSSTIAFTFDPGTGSTSTRMKSTVSRAPNAVALVYDRSNVSGPIIGTWTDARISSPSIVPRPYAIRRLVEERTGRPSLAQANAAATAYATRSPASSAPWSTAPCPCRGWNPGTPSPWARRRRPGRVDGHTGRHAAARP